MFALRPLDWERLLTQAFLAEQDQQSEGPYHPLQHRCHPMNGQIDSFLHVSIH